MAAEDRRVPGSDESVEEPNGVPDVADLPKTGGKFSSSSSSTEDEPSVADARYNLLRAAEVGDLERCRRILAAEPEKIHLADAEGYTPLHRACYNDRIEVAKLLISHGADYHRRTKEGWEPLHSAARWGATRCVEMLLDLPGVDVNSSTCGGLTPLHLAVLNPNFRDAAVELLMNRGVDTTIRSRGGQTAFEVARSSSDLYKLFEIAEPMFNL